MGKRTRSIFLAVAVILYGVPALADDPRPEIISVEVYRSAGSVIGDVSSRNLFSQRVTGTVQSGLPAVVEVAYRLVFGKESVGHGLIALELRYDVWDDRYLVSGADSVRYFDSFAAMRNSVEHMRAVRFAPLADISGDDTYALQLSIAVHPLRSADERDIEGWVSANVRGGTTEHNNATNETWRERVVNINDLIDHFFKRNRDVSDRSKWYTTPPFKPAALPKQGEE